jgi:hypothetical protein
MPGDQGNAISHPGYEVQARAGSGQGRRAGSRPLSASESRPERALRRGLPQGGVEETELVDGGSFRGEQDARRDLSENSRGHCG